MSLQVSPDHIRLQINGEVGGERPLSSLLNNDSDSSSFKKIFLANFCDDDNTVWGYVYSFSVFSLVSSIKDHHIKVIVVLILKLYGSFSFSCAFY